MSGCPGGRGPCRQQQGRVQQASDQRIQNHVTSAMNQRTGVYRRGYGETLGKARPRPV
jgi:hypothetical protein